MHNVTFIPSPNQVVFYPIGNTPAVNLLSQHLAKEDKDAQTEILSLACGDPRSILYSLWCEGKPGAEKFNFTCCDLDVGVLARNVLLLSLMIDNTEAYASSTSESPDSRLAAIWNLWYHFFLSQKDLDLVREQSSKLLEYSASPEKWNSSPFKVIKFVSLQSLGEIRKIWTKYTLQRSAADDAKYETARRAEIQAVYNRMYAPGGQSMTFYGGPHWKKGIKIMNAGLRGYWTHGVAGGNKADIAALGADRKGFMNPLFIISSVSEVFSVHFTSDPLIGFHLTSVLDVDGPEDEVVETMVKLAKMQFQEWSKAFVGYSTENSVRVNIYYGDAVSFCHELASKTTSTPASAVVTHLYAAQWSTKPLLLDGDGGKDLPMFFDVIDTSNLADWIGLLNILPVASQILAREDTSVLYTESFRLNSKEPDDELYDSLYMDVDLASVLIGVAPLGHLVGYSTDNNFGEDIVHLQNPNRYRIRIPWKLVLDHKTKTEVIHPSSDRRIEFDADELAETFFEVYLKMFAQENLKESMNQVKATKGKMPMHSSVFNRYSRLSLATLIRHVMRNVNCDWQKFYAQILDKIEKDESLHIGHDCMIDLILQLSMNGALENAFTKVDPNPNPRKFKQVTLVVPRSDLKVFDKLGGAPGIHLCVTKNGSNNLFFAIDCFFGSVKKGPRDDSWEEVIEDPKGWAGSSDLIITTPVPPELVETGKFDVGLLVTISLHAHNYMGVLGPEMCIYMTGNKNKKRVLTSDYPPGITKDRFNLDEIRNSLPSSLEPDASLATSASTATGPLIFKAKYSLEEGSEEAVALFKAAIVSVPEEEWSPCSLLLRIAPKFDRRFIFPFPINADKAKFRIARKSRWIEVTVPAASALLSGGYDLTPFPVVIEDNSQPLSWSLPRFDLSKQPRIASMDPEVWFAESLEQFLSVREKRIISKGPDIPKNSPFRSVLPIFKKTVAQITMHLVDTPSKNVFVLAGPIPPPGETPIIDTLLVANCLRHARETGTMILDAWVIPITSDTRNDFMATFMPQGADAAQVFMLDDQEMFIWKNIFPAAAESCRRDWVHRSDCEYLKEKKIPLSTKRWESPLCSCGEGKDVEDFPKKSFVKGFMKFATRVAIPSLSAVSYVEAMDPEMVF